MIVTDNRVAAFVSEKLNASFCPPFTCLGIESDGEIIAGVIFNVFEGSDVHATAAGSRWSKEFMYALGEYVFDQLKCLRMTMVVSERRVGKLAEKLGAKREGVLRNHFGVGKDGILYGCLKDEYKYSPL